MSDDLRQLRQRVADLSDEELQRMVTVEARDYRKEAIDFALRELEARGVALTAENATTAGGGDEVESPDDPDDADEADARTQGPACAACGGPVRAAVLVGEREIIAVFRNGEERRFVDIVACTRCGEARLVVDLESNVAED
jgi:hypothetical protein